MEPDDLIIETELETRQYTAAFLVLAHQVEMDDDATDMEKIAGRLIATHFGVGEIEH